MFSLALLSVMVTLATDMVIAVAASFWTSSLLGAGPDSISSMALQQGGMGIVLSMLIMTAPPMAAMFFSGTLGSFVPYSQMTANAPARNQSMPQGYWPAAAHAATAGEGARGVEQRVAYPVDAHAMSRLVGTSAAVEPPRGGPRA
jgi:type IV secretion system protein VirB6